MLNGIFFTDILRVFKNIPFFRICIPFVGGILLSLQSELNAVSSWFLFFVFLFALAFPFFKRQTAFTKTAFLICTDVFLFCFAINLVSAERINNSKDFYGNIISPDTLNKLIAEVTDLPIDKGSFIKCDLRVLEVKKDSAYIPAKGKLNAYFKKGGPQLKFGQTLLLNIKLNEAEAPKNPLEFDYKNYLENKQVYHISFVDSSAFKVLDTPSRLSLIWSVGLKAKYWILSRLKNSGLSPEAYGISAALLTGFDDDIDKTVMEAFSHSGTLHVLSVSGLHTGLIYLVLAFLFDLADRKKKYKVLKFIFITLSLWSFALITGFSAPVLRAVIMFNLLGLGKIFFRNNYRNQINILMVSAFILLCYNPFWITDIGFQLSYCALFGILFFQPIFSNVWEPKNRISRYIWQSVTASFAATITTLPFTLFYFKQFPMWFFVCNLVVVPATFVVLLLAVLAVLNVSGISLVINFIIKFLIGFINLFNSPDFGFIDNIDFTWFDGIVLSIFIILFSITFYYRSHKYLVYSFVVIIFWQVNGIISSYQNKDQKLFTVYHIKKEPAYCFKNKRDVTVTEPGRANFNYHVKPHFISFNYPRLQHKEFNYMKINEKGVLILNKNNFWPDVDSKGISTIVLSNNFHFTESDFERFNNLTLIIADGTNKSYSLKQLAKLCSKFAVEFYSTGNKGAYILNF